MEHLNALGAGTCLQEYEIRTVLGHHFPPPKG